MANYEHAPSPNRREITDFSLPIPMFEEATITEFGDRKELHVPTRHLRTEKYGTWTLDIRGATKWFKEHDDYGSHRNTENGTSMWIPHVYGFEDINPNTNMPTIIDQERMKIAIVLELKTGDTTPKDTGLAIETSMGAFAATPDVNYYYGSYPYGSYLRFDEFENTTASLRAEHVTLIENEQHQSVSQYLDEILSTQGLPAFLAAEIAPLPPHVSTRFYHDNFATRPHVHLPENRHFGKLWIPVSTFTQDNLQADIHLPMFNV